MGKTSIISNFMYGTFDDTHQPTIGIDFLSKAIQLQDRAVKLQLWDTAGQERFRSLIPNFIRDSCTAVIVYDMTLIDTFSSVEQWAEDIRNVSGNHMTTFLVGNKLDLAENRVVGKDEGEEKARQLSMKFIETSAKTGEGVKELFRKMAEDLPQDRSTENNEKFYVKTGIGSGERGCKC